MIPEEIKISDPTWQSFLYEVIQRFVRPFDHEFLLDFLQRVACAYLTSKRSKIFVFDLLELNIPKLLAVNSEEIDGGEEKEMEEDHTVEKKLIKFLRNYIESNDLIYTLLSRTKKLFVSWQWA